MIQNLITTLCRTRLLDSFNHYVVTFVTDGRDINQALVVKQDSFVNPFKSATIVEKHKFNHSYKLRLFTSVKSLTSTTFHEITYYILGISNLLE